MKRISFVFALLLCIATGATAQTYDTILKWPYLHYYNWPETFIYSDSMQCSKFEYSFHCVDRNYERWYGHDIWEYAVYQHTDVPLNVVGIAFNDCGYDYIAELCLYDSAMNVVARDTTRGMPSHLPVIFTDTTTYKILKVPGLDHSGLDQHDIMSGDEIFLKMKRFSVNNTIEVVGDFWIGISVYVPDNHNSEAATTYICENHETPYHITNVRYRALDNGTWVDDTAEGAIPELLALIEPVCHTVTGLSAVMDSMGNVDISWDSADNQTKWVVHFTGPGGVMETDTVTSCHKHYGGLYPNKAYSVKVNARCYQSKYNIWSGWSETIWVGNTTGSIAEAEAFSFTMKPNPAKDKVTIAADGYDGTATVSIATVGGMEVLLREKAALPLTIDLAGLASGIYMVRVSTATGTATNRLVVQ